MTREELIESMEIIIKKYTPEDAAEYIHRLWMDHQNYEIHKGVVRHITKGVDISQRVPKDT